MGRTKLQGGGATGNPGPRLRGAARDEALAWARNWRLCNRARFDALYPETVNPVRCAACGQALREIDDDPA